MEQSASMTCWSLTEGNCQSKHLHRVPCFRGCFAKSLASACHRESMLAQQTSHAFAVDFALIDRLQMIRESMAPKLVGVVLSHRLRPVGEPVVGFLHDALAHRFEAVN